jgi:hypothetical protein
MFLSMNPHVTKKMREEHSQVFHEDLTETLNILRDAPQKLDQLEYTTAVIKETLRLFPPGGVLREADEGYSLLSLKLRTGYDADFESATLDYNGQKYPIDNHIAIMPVAHTVHHNP